MSLFFVNPWIREDGVGYYADVRSLLIDGDLHFENEWQAGNPTFTMGRVEDVIAYQSRKREPVAASRRFAENGGSPKG